MARQRLIESNLIWRFILGPIRKTQDRERGPAAALYKLANFGFRSILRFVREQVETRSGHSTAGLFIIAFETPRCYGHGGKRPPVYLRSNTSIDLHYAIPAVNRRARARAHGHSESKSTLTRHGS